VWRPWGIDSCGVGWKHARKSDLLAFATQAAEAFVPA
jgi:hypothetical protein